MKLNLDTLRSEIQEYLESRGMAVFHGSPREGGDPPTVYWDTKGHPDYHAFLAAAESAGVRLVTLWANDFSEELLDDALDQLQTSGIPREETRTIRAHLTEMRAYAGFTCQIELSFDLGPRVYVFDLRTEWFDDLNELLDRIDATFDSDDEEALGGGYFSKN